MGLVGPFDGLEPAILRLLLSLVSVTLGLMAGGIFAICTWGYKEKTDESVEGLPGDSSQGEPASPGPPVPPKTPQYGKQRDNYKLRELVLPQTLSAGPSQSISRKPVPSPTSVPLNFRFASGPQSSVRSTSDTRGPGEPPMPTPQAWRKPQAGEWKAPYASSPPSRVVTQNGSAGFNKVIPRIDPEQGEEMRLYDVHLT